MSEILRVNATSKVPLGAIKRIMHNGREHLVIPSFTLPDNVVMNGGLYPADEIAKSYMSLKGTPAPIGHPVVNGKPVKATAPEAINAHYCGAWNHVVQRDESTSRIYIEKWVDVEFAAQSEQGQRLLDAIEAGTPLHTSTGLYCRRDMETNGAAGYSWIARDMQFDHDAILFDEPGAATPEDGVGLMVNKAELVVNAHLPELELNQALENSYGQKKEALAAALKEVYGSNDVYPYVEDFNDNRVIFYANGYKMVDYELDGPAIVLGDTVTEMRARTEFVAKGATVVTSLALTGNSVECDPVKPIVENEVQPEMDETKIAELVTNSIKAALEPVTERLEASEAENKRLREALETNSKAADEENRATIIAAKPELEAVAKELTGNALATLAASVQTAAPLKSGRMQVNSAEQTALNDFDNYKGA